MELSTVNTTIVNTPHTTSMDKRLQKSEVSKKWCNPRRFGYVLFAYNNTIPKGGLDITQAIGYSMQGHKVPSLWFFCNDHYDKEHMNRYQRYIFFSAQEYI